MQLDALLRSIVKYFPYSDKVIILFEATDLHLRTYHKSGSGDYFYLWEQGNFKQNTEAILSATDQICFLCDDDIFYKPVPEKPVATKWHTVSLRLGPNVTDKKHFKYTISRDGNVFRTWDLLKCMEKIEYNNPNQLEGGLVPYHAQFRMTTTEQYLINVPHNRVSDTSRCGFSGKWTEDVLAKMFLEGKRIDIDAMDYTNIPNVQKEIDYEFYG